VIAVLLDIATRVALFTVVMAGLNLIVGFGRIFSVNQALLFGVGAFSYAGMVKFLGANELLLAWAIGALVAAVLSLLVAFVALRVSGDHFIIASFGVQLGMLQVLYNWGDLSGGPAGAFGLPRPEILGITVISPAELLLLAVVVAVATLAVAQLVVRSPYGRLVKAMADDEDALTAGGFEVLPLKVGVFVLGGAFAAIAGATYASYLGVAQSNDFSINVSIMLLAAVTAGGLRSTAGGVLGALLFVGLPSALNLLDVPVSIAGPLQQLVFGLLLVIVMLFLPTGIAGLFSSASRILSAWPGRGPRSLG